MQDQHFPRCCFSVLPPLTAVHTQSPQCPVCSTRRVAQLRRWPYARHAIIKCALLYSSFAAGAVGNIGCGCPTAAEYKLHTLLSADPLGR
jgi:hypothetical protein